MGFSTILGLDLGKFKSVCCVMNVSTHAQTFETIQTTPQGLHDLLTLHIAAAAAAAAGGHKGVILAFVQPQRRSLHSFIVIVS